MKETIEKLNDYFKVVDKIQEKQCEIWRSIIGKLDKLNESLEQSLKKMKEAYDAIHIEYKDDN